MPSEVIIRLSGDQATDLKLLLLSEARTPKQRSEMNFHDRLDEGVRNVVLKQIKEQLNG